MPRSVMSLAAPGRRPARGAAAALMLAALAACAPQPRVAAPAPPPVTLLGAPVFMPGGAPSRPSLAEAAAAPAIRPAIRPGAAPAAPPAPAAAPAAPPGPAGRAGPAPAVALRAARDDSDLYRQFCAEASEAAARPDLALATRHPTQAEIEDCARRGVALTSVKLAENAGRARREDRGAFLVYDAAAGREDARRLIARIEENRVALFGAPGYSELFRARS